MTRLRMNNIKMYINRFRMIFSCVLKKQSIIVTPRVTHFLNHLSTFGFVCKVFSDFRIFNLIVGREIQRGAHSKPSHHIPVIIRIVNLTTIYVVKLRFGITSQFLIDAPMENKSTVDYVSSAEYFMAYLQLGRSESTSGNCLIIRCYVD